MAVPFELLVLEDLHMGVGTVDVTMPAGGTAKGHRINAETFGPSGLVWPLGGSLLTAVKSAAQVDVIDPVTFRLPTMDLSAFVLEVTVTARTDSAGTSVQPVIQDITNGVAIGAGQASVSLVDDAYTFTIDGAVLPTTGPLCKLQMIPGNANAGIYLNGYARLYVNAGRQVSFSPYPPPTPPPAPSAAEGIWPLGGSLQLGLIGSARTDVVDAVSIELPAGDLSAFNLQVVVTCRTDDAGTSVRPVFRDVTHSADVGLGAVSTSVTNAVQSFIIAGSSLPTSGPVCRLQLQPGNNGANIYGNGYARLYLA